MLMDLPPSLVHFCGRRSVIIVGVLPLALIVSTGAELHRPLAVVYIGGSFFAIILKMVIVPVLYELLAKIGKERWLKKA